MWCMKIFVHTLVLSMVPWPVAFKTWNVLCGLINVDNLEYFTTSTITNVVRSQVGIFFILHENISLFGRNFDEYHSFASELGHAAEVIVLSEMWFSANTCCDVQGYTGFHSYCADKSGGSVSVFFKDVTHRHMWPIFQCVMHILSLVW